jgi:PKD repeat protein
LDVPNFRIVLDTIPPLTLNLAVDGRTDLLKNWTWDFGDGVVSTELSTSHTYLKGGRYIITFAGITTLNNTVRTNIDFEFCPTDIPIVIDNPKCNHVEIRPPYTGEFYTSIAWGDGTFNDSLTHTYQEPGTKTIVLKFKSDVCEDTVIRTETLLVGTAPAPDFNWDHVGTTYYFKDLTTGLHSNNPLDFLWTFDGNIGPSGKEVEWYFEPGPHTVRLTVKGPNECVIDTSVTKTIFVQIAQPPFLEPYIDSCECPNSIDAPLYRYPKSNSVILVRADALAIFDFPASEEFDMVDSEPEIHWDSRDITPGSHIVAVITHERPQFDEGHLLNINPGDWMWTSRTPSTLGDGAVRFMEGKTIEGINNYGPILGNSPPTPLVPGEFYYWLVYAFNENGTLIDGCTRIHPIKIRP